MIKWDKLPKNLIHYEEIDEEIRDSIFKINEFEDVRTLGCCQGNYCKKFKGRPVYYFKHDLKSGNIIPREYKSYFKYPFVVLLFKDKVKRKEFLSYFTQISKNIGNKISSAIYIEKIIPENRENKKERFFKNNTIVISKFNESCLSLSFYIYLEDADKYYVHKLNFDKFIKKIRISFFQYILETFKAVLNN